MCFVGSLNIPSRWLESKLRELGLDTYLQNFTFKYPVGILKGHVCYELTSTCKTVCHS